MLLPDPPSIIEQNTANEYFSGLSQDLTPKSSFADFERAYAAVNDLSLMASSVDGGVFLYLEEQISERLGESSDNLAENIGCRALLIDLYMRESADELVIDLLEELEALVTEESVNEASIHNLSLSYHLTSYLTKLVDSCIEKSEKGLSSETAIEIAKRAIDVISRSGNDLTAIEKEIELNVKLGGFSITELINELSKTAVSELEYNRIVSKITKLALTIEELPQNDLDTLERLIQRSYTSFSDIIRFAALNINEGLGINPEVIELIREAIIRQIGYAKTYPDDSKSAAIDLTELVAIPMLDLNNFDANVEWLLYALSQIQTLTENELEVHLQSIYASVAAVLVNVHFDGIVDNEELNEALAKYAEHFGVSEKATGISEEFNQVYGDLDLTQNAIDMIMQSQMNMYPATLLKSFVEGYRISHHPEYVEKLLYAIGNNNSNLSNYFREFVDIVRIAYQINDVYSLKVAFEYLFTTEPTLVRSVMRTIID